MNTTNHARVSGTGALRGDLRACEDSPRPIAPPARCSNKRIGSLR
jgi:hypothetical protein